MCKEMKAILYIGYTSMIKSYQENCSKKGTDMLFVFDSANMVLVKAPRNITRHYMLQSLALCEIPDTLTLISRSK